MKTSELTGVQLDWAVTHANYEINGEHIWGTENCNYSTDWALGGAIIEREGITVAPDDVEPWCAFIDRGTAEDVIYGGTTPLIAAMRCYVASKLGDEVELPEGL